MAKKNRQEVVPEIDWLSRDRHMSDGLDPLGVQVVSVNLYGQLLPGLTNVTDRVRYCAFYPWIVHRYASAGGKRGDRDKWLDWFRRIEWTYALACIAHEKASKREVTGVTGALIARRQLQEPPSKIDIATGALTRSKSKTAYIESLEGGFGQYKGSLALLGVLDFPDGARYPDSQVTEWAGRPLVETLDQTAGFDLLLDVARSGSADFARRDHPDRTHVITWIGARDRSEATPWVAG